MNNEVMAKEEEEPSDVTTPRIDCINSSEGVSVGVAEEESSKMHLRRSHHACLGLKV